MVGLHFGTGRGRRAGEQGEFGDLGKISRFAPVHAICQRPREMMTKGVHLQHRWPQGAPLNMSGAGARDSITAVAREVVEDVSTACT